MATFTNQAQLTYDGRTVASNTVTGQITQSVTLTKIALTDEYAPDDTVTFVVTLTNSGQTAITSFPLSSLITFSFRLFPPLYLQFSPVRQALTIIFK